jgi:DnaK suppressor protein
MKFRDNTKDCTMPKSFTEFEKQLNEMKKSLESNIARLEREMDMMGTEDEIEDREDMATLVGNTLEHKSLLKQQLHELEEVNHALAKIPEGSYGICEKSGKPIPLDRLRAEPHARCIIQEAE